MNKPMMIQANFDDTGCDLGTNIILNKTERAQLIALTNRISLADNSKPITRVNYPTDDARTDMVVSMDAGAVMVVAEIVLSGDELRELISFVVKLAARLGYGSAKLNLAYLAPGEPNEDGCKSISTKALISTRAISQAA